MDKRTRQRRINDCLRLVDNSYKLVKNYVKPHKGNSNSHELAKFKVCLDLIREGREVYTEVRFKGFKGRCDILVPELMQVIEILANETEEECLKKTRKYPKQVNITMIKVSEVLKVLNNEKKIYF